MNYKDGDPEGYREVTADEPLDLPGHYRVAYQCRRGHRFITEAYTLVKCPKCPEDMFIDETYYGDGRRKKGNAKKTVSDMIDNFKRGIF